MLTRSYRASSVNIVTSLRAGRPGFGSSSVQCLSGITSVCGGGFHDAVGIDNMASDGTTDVEGIEALTRHLPGGTEGNHENLRIAGAPTGIRM
jgi:hypothetical protein